MASYLDTNWNYDSDDLVEVFDELPLWAAPFGLKLLEQIRIRGGMQVLDVGFGSGFPLTELAMRLGQAGLVTGIDPWEAAIRRAEKKIVRYGITNARIIRGQAEKIPLGDSTQDLVVSNNGLNNVRDIEQALAECARVLKPGGQFAQTLNLDGTMAAFYEVMGGVLQEHGLAEALTGMRAQIRMKRPDLEEYLQQIRQHGFQVSSVAYDQFAYRFVDGTAFLNHYVIRLAFLDGWKGIVPPGHQEEVFSAIEEGLNRKASEQGELRMDVPFVVIDCQRQ